MADRVLPSAPFTTPMPSVKPPKASRADLVEAAVRYAREGGAGFDTEAERNIAELGARRAISLLTREEGFYDASFVPESAEPDSLELIVADCLPDDDDGGEEPGAMCKRVLARAEASVDRRSQITEWALKEVVGGVRGFGVERGANDLWHVLMQDGSLAFTLSEDVVPARPGAAKKVVGALYTAWMNGMHGERARAATRAPNTITPAQTLALVRERIEGVLRAPHYAEEVLKLAIADIDAAIGGEERAAS